MKTIVVKSSNLDKLIFVFFAFVINFSLFLSGGNTMAATENKKLEPSAAKEKAPDKFDVELTTTKGKVVIQIHRDWSPNGADRFYNLVKMGFYNDIGIFRVVKGFMAQMGVNSDPKVTQAWSKATISDDKVIKSNKRGFVTFAMTSHKNSRTTQFFINYGDNSFLDPQGFTPFGEVTKGMDVVDKFFVTGEAADQGRLSIEGNNYLKKEFKDLDYIKSSKFL